MFLTSNFTRAGIILCSANEALPDIVLARSEPSMLEECCETPLMSSKSLEDDIVPSTSIFLSTFEFTSVIPYDLLDEWKLHVEIPVA